MDHVEGKKGNGWGETERGFDVISNVFWSLREGFLLLDQCATGILRTGEFTLYISAVKRVVFDEVSVRRQQTMQRVMPR